MLARPPSPASAVVLALNATALTEDGQRIQVRVSGVDKPLPNDMVSGEGAAPGPPRAQARCTRS